MDAIVMKPAMNTAEVAQALGYSPRRFRDHLPDLEAHGFPAPLPGLTSRWSRQAVLDWINRPRHDALAVRVVRETNAFSAFEGA